MLSLLLLIALAKEPPTLCIELDAQAQIDASNLLAAIGARIARKQVEVRACGPAEPGTWRVRVSRVNPTSVSLALTGPEVDVTRTVTIDGMTPDEVVQYISATAAEAVRPSIEKLLGVESSTEDLIARLEAKVAPKCPEATPCPEPKIEVRTVQVPIEPTPAFNFSIGPLFAFGTERVVSGYLELGGDFATGLFFAGLRAGLHWVPSATSGDVRLRLWEIEAALDAGVRLAIVRLGVRAQGRLSLADSDGVPTIVDGLQSFWNGGLGLFTNVAVWTTPIFELRILARAWVWPQPNRFLVEGREVLNQSHFELLIGPEVALGESFSKGSGSDQGTE